MRLLPRSAGHTAPPRAWRPAWLQDGDKLDAGVDLLSEPYVRDVLARKGL